MNTRRQIDQLFEAQRGIPWKRVFELLDEMGDAWERANAFELEDISDAAVAPYFEMKRLVREAKRLLAPTGISLHHVDFAGTRSYPEWSLTGMFWRYNGRLYEPFDLRETITDFLHNPSTPATMASAALRAMIPSAD